MKLALTLLWLALLSHVAFGQEKVTMQSVRSVRDIQLDTNPESRFWKEAGTVKAEVGKSGKKIEQFSTEVRSRWTNDNMYFLFVCPYRQLSLKPGPDVQKETYELWNWNVAEVFLGSDFRDIKRYKEFEVSPQNEWIDLDIDLNKPHHEEGWAWNSGFEHAARVDVVHHVWYVAMKIPFKAIDSRPPEPGNKFRANFYRTDGKDKSAVEVMWRPVMSSTFHVPERFGELVLVAK
jgi:Carbohydrate family 9 binding domain-like